MVYRKDVYLSSHIALIKERKCLSCNCTGSLICINGLNNIKYIYANHWNKEHICFIISCVSNNMISFLVREGFGHIKINACKIQTAFK